MENNIVLLIFIIFILVLFFVVNYNRKESFWVRPECRDKCHYNIMLNYPLNKISYERSLNKPLYSVPFGYYNPNLPDHT